MTAEMYIGQDVAGCVNANWHLARPSSFRLDAF